MTYRICIVLGFLMLLVTLAPCQTAADLRYVRAALIAKPAPRGFDHTSTKESRRLGQRVAAAGFSFYKTCISSQDFKHCNFTLSCSEFCLRAVQQHGLPLGLAMGLDRYSRCHAMHRSFYPKDIRRNRAIDPVTQ